MSKFLKSFLVSIFLFFVFVGEAKAGELMIKGIDMPSWVNWEPIYISYTALETEGKPINVKAYIKKEGESWQEVGSSNKLSDTFRIERSYFPDNGVYKIYFKEVNSGKTTPEESFNVDFTPPSGVSEYRKERKDANVYKICWKNPGDDDFDRVIIFRSERTDGGFDKIGELGGVKDEEKCFENGTPDNRDYYYLIRAIDHAGNASYQVGDSEITTGEAVLGTAVATPTPATVVLPLSKVSPTTTPAGEEGQILGGTTDEEEISQPGVMQKATQAVAKFGFWKILGIVVIIAGIIILFTSFFKKRS